MHCPVCKRTLSKTQELLSEIEDVYYCPHCWVRIADRATREKEAAERKARTEAVPVAN